MPSRQPRKPLTKEQRRTICAVLATGCRYESAAHFGGTSVARIRRDAEVDRAFRRALKIAESQCELTHMQTVLAAAKDPKNWRASTWALERRFPDRYGKRQAAAVTREQLSQIVEQLADIIAEEVPRAKYRRRILDRVAALLSEFSTARRSK